MRSGWSDSVTRIYSYNAYQELCAVNEPETGATLMGYDAAGNLAWSASGLPLGSACDDEGDTAAILARKATRTYDARNRVTALNFADAMADVTYGYTPTGQLAGVAAYNGGGFDIVTTSYTYNGRGMLEYERQFLAGSTWTHDWIIDYGYDANGHLSWQKVNAYGPAHTVAYAPNALGQPTQAGTYATNVTYFPNGAMKSFTYGNGIVHTLTQNDRGLPDRSRDAYGSSVIHDDSYIYDQVGNVAAITDGVSGHPGDRDMAYDDLNRLTSASAPDMFGTATYTYDALDNLRSVHVTAGNQPRNHVYEYDTRNRLTNVTSGGATVIGLGYDAQGNLANRNGVLYTFDLGNRLRSVSSPASAYLYDGQGRRVWDGTGGSRYSVYSQAGQLVFDYDKRSQRYRWYVYLNGSLVAIHDEDYETDATRTTYQHTDALGSPVATTDESRVVLQRSEYEPYGALVNRPLEDGPGYTGHETDAGTGLVYMQQRYYDPGIGRFLSVDPVTASSVNGSNFNRYWYANDNPYKFIDPDGRATYVTYRLPNQNVNTIVTDGKGGIKVHLGNTGGMGPVVREGVRRHEETHIADFHSNCESTCGIVEGAEAGLGIGIVEPGEAAASEVRASNVEIDYLGSESSKPRNRSEKPAIQTRIRQMTQYRDANQQIVDQQQSTPPPPPAQTPPPPPPPSEREHPNGAQ